MADQPSWVLALIAAVEQYEDSHPRVDEPGWDCLAPALDGVPDDVRAMARGYGQARTDTERTHDDAEPFERFYPNQAHDSFAICPRCVALVRPDDQQRHRDWHAEAAP